MGWGLTPAGFSCSTSLLQPPTIFDVRPSTRDTSVHPPTGGSQTAAGLTMRPTWKAAWLAIGILDIMAAAASVRLISCVIQETCMGQMDCWAPSVSQEILCSMLGSTPGDTGRHAVLSHADREGAHRAGLQALLSSLGESWMRALRRGLLLRQLGRQRSRGCPGPSWLMQGQRE